MVLRLTGEDRARVRSLVARSFGPLRTKGVELREFEGAIVSALVAAMPGGVRERDNGSERQCAFRKALEYLRANLGEAVCIEDLCRVSGVGARTLRRAFHQESGMGPIAFARAQRLSHARRLLKSGRANSVTQAALASGFSELGRFAASYRAMFGELPSSTRDSRLAENA